MNIVNKLYCNQLNKYTLKICVNRFIDRKENGKCELTNDIFCQNREGQIEKKDR